MLLATTIMFTGIDYRPSRAAPEALEVYEIEV